MSTAICGMRGYLKEIMMMTEEHLYEVHGIDVGEPPGWYWYENGTDLYLIKADT